MKFKATRHLIKQKRYPEAYEEMKSSEDLVLDKGVTFDYKFDPIKSNQMERLLPHKNEIDDFIDFIYGCFYLIKAKNLAFNLAKGLVIKFPYLFKPNFVFSELNSELGIYSLAQKHILKAISIEPKNAEAHNNFGNILSRKGDYEGAIHEYNEAIKNNPELPEAHLNLAIALENQNDFEGAEIHLKRALEINPDYLHAQVRYAEYTLLFRRDKKNFKKHLREIENKYPDNPWLDYLYYLKYSKTKKKKEAMSHMHKFIEKLAEDQIIPSGMVDYINIKKDLKRFEKTLDELIEREPDNPFDLNSKGWILLWKGELEKAEEYIKKAIDIHPHFIEAKKNYLSILIAKNEIDRAQEICEDILNLSPNSVTAKLFLADIYIRKNNIIYARSLLNEILRLNENIVEANYLLAFTLVLEKKFSEAETFAKKSLSQHFGYEFCYFLYGKILFHNKKYKEAEENFKYFIERIYKYKKIFLEEIVQSYYFTAYTYFNIENFKMAKRLLIKAIKHKKDKKFFNDIAVASIRQRRFWIAKKYLNKSFKLDKFYLCSIQNKKQLDSIFNKLKIKYLLITFLILIVIVSLIMGRQYFLFTLAISTLIAFLLFSKKPKLIFEIPIKNLKFTFSDEFDFNIEEKHIPLILSMYEEANGKGFMV